MNRREAIAALVSLPPTARISVATLKPDDVIIVESDELLSQEAVTRIVAKLQYVWPNRKVLVLDRSLRIRIASGSETGGGS